MPTTLRDLGERYILQHIIPEYCDGAGDDCAVIALPSSDIIVTTDPVPIPAAQVIGGDPDPYWVGWLLVVINASDLAAAGATPLGFVSALELEADWTVDLLERLLLGTRDACRVEGLPYIGGNRKEGLRLSAVGTAIGHSRPKAALTRRGAMPGDILMRIGSGGVFWRDAIATLRGMPVADKMRSPLFAPRSQLRVMSSLAEKHLINAAIDNSDGLLPSLNQLAVANSISITVEVDRLLVPDSGCLEVDPAKLWLGWGDWNVLAAVSEERVDGLFRTGKEHGIQVTKIGGFQRGNPSVLLKRRGQILAAPRLESERFAADSWLSDGIQSYIDRLLAVELPN